MYCMGNFTEMVNKINARRKFREVRSELIRSRERNLRER